MARGFESKDVEWQQAEASRGAAPRAALSREEREAANRRRTLEMTVTRLQHELSCATAAAHRQMLEAGIAALQAQLSALA